jgi:hypothetical protein
VLRAWATLCSTNARISLGIANCSNGSLAIVLLLLHPASPS